MKKRLFLMSLLIMIILMGCRSRGDQEESRNHQKESPEFTVTRTYDLARYQPSTGEVSSSIFDTNVPSTQQVSGQEPEGARSNHQQRQAEPRQHPPQPLPETPRTPRPSTRPPQNESEEIGQPPQLTTEEQMERLDREIREKREEIAELTRQIRLIDRDLGRRLPVTDRERLSRMQQRMQEYCLQLVEEVNALRQRRVSLGEQSSYGYRYRP